MEGHDFHETAQVNPPSLIWGDEKLRTT